LLEGRPPSIHGDGEQSRDFTYVTNNAKANLLAATADIEARGQVYNIACGASCSVIAMYRKLSELIEVDMEPTFTEPRVGDVRMSRADIALAKEDLGYEVEVDFDEGLRRTVDWYREEYRQGRGL
jgi:nucleoside-diphosphate-sugar epimerase